MKHSRFNLMLASILFVALAACSNIGLQNPQTPEDGFRYSQTMMTGIYTTLGNAATDKSLDPLEARKYHDRMEQPYQDMQLIDKGVRASGGKVPADLVGKLNLTMNILNGIAAELKQRLPPASTKPLPTIVPAPV